MFILAYMDMGQERQDTILYLCWITRGTRLAVQC